jgi:hypothetical protein
MRHVLSIIEDRHIGVSSLYIVDMAVDALAGKPLLVPRLQQPKVDVIHIPCTTIRSSNELCKIDASFGSTRAESTTLLEQRLIAKCEVRVYCRLSSGGLTKSSG